MAEEAKKDEASAAPESGGGGGSKLVIILSGVNAIAAIAAMAFGFLAFKKAQQPHVADIVNSAENENANPASSGGKSGEGTSATAESQPPKAIDLDKFIINLNNDSGIATMSLQISFDGETDMADLEKRKPQIRDLIINSVGSKKQAELATAVGRTRLKEEIRAAVTGILPKGKATGVFFLSFYVSGG